ncbi:hypothetical protein FACS189449_05760 [Alphaproteobacteria bacterium]|nr:hypothetical protein FACS189449_05760 [Alphaproteobacteria bacterium]
MSFDTLKLPERIRLETCTLCQLSCPGCAFGRGEYCNFGAGYLKYEDFEKFVQMNPFVKIVELVSHGEIFLNPDLQKIIEFAYSKDVSLTAWHGVNFNDVEDGAIESMVKYDFKGMCINLDGTSQETYEKYRRNGKFPPMISNVKSLCEYKRKYSSAWPQLILSYVIFEHNSSREELRRAKQIAEELCIDLYFRKDLLGYIPEDIEMIREETGLVYERVIPKYTDAFLRPQFLPCTILWEAPVINYDGRFLGCHLNDVGIADLNVFDLGLKECLEAPIVQNMKKMLMGGELSEDAPCCLCWNYRSLVWNDAFITAEEVSFQ